MPSALLIALLQTSALSGMLHAQPTEVLGEVRVHGNHTTPDSDILAIAALTLNAPVSQAALDEAARRLRESGRFDSVLLRKRSRSIDNPADVLVIVLVNEVEGVSEDNLMPGPLRRLRSRSMWLPIVDYTDGYGFTYGARVSFANVLGPRSRVSVPLTWGGERRVGAEAERSFAGGPISRVEARGSLFRRRHPHFDTAETRREVRVGTERALTTWLRVGGGATYSDVSFGALDDRLLAPEFVAIVDNRLDPTYPRNAVHLTTRIERLRFDRATDASRASFDLRGYVGLVGSSVLALRAATVRATNTLPPFEQQLLGGESTLRGFKVGHSVGDNMAAASAELRVPLTSPLNLGRFGVRAFWDAATVYDAGAALSDQRFHQGVGGGVFLTLAVVQMGVDVAWPLTTVSRKPRWHVGLGVVF